MLSETSQRKTNAIDLTHMWNYKKAKFIGTKQNGGQQELGGKRKWGDVGQRVQTLSSEDSNVEDSDYS